MEEKQKEMRSKKGFFTRLFEKIDKKMEEKAKSGCCCNSNDKGDKKSCCN